ncbi:UPF0606 protein KIAA1549-like isoform X2 [Scyliorhinus canicula]|uniref:UPF0606 protein KIAA1549-like isoform X2 n=1 Tax=Scyliorhinus canicula TaxID=7830 RepID=UPI0018F3D467|nr:UPF0606 protein KIAA1549-like isoform X2 [Scyliorhinus canicula]
MERRLDRRRRRLSPLFSGYRPWMGCRLLGHSSSFFLVASLLLWLPASGSLPDEDFSDDALLSGTILEPSLGLTETVDTALMKQDGGTLITSISVESASQSSLNPKEIIHLSSDEVTAQIKDLIWSAKVVLSENWESSTIRNLEVTPLSELATMVTEEYQTTISLHLIAPTSVIPVSFLSNSAISQSSEPPITSAFLSSSILVYPLSFLTVSSIPILASSKQQSEPVSPRFSSVAVSNQYTWHPTKSAIMADLDIVKNSETVLLSYIGNKSSRTETIFPHDMEDLTVGNEIFPTSIPSSREKFEITGEFSVDHVETSIHNALTSELVSEINSRSDLPQLLISADAALSDSNSVTNGVTLTEFYVPVLSTHLFASPSTNRALFSPSSIFHTHAFGSDFGSGDDPEITTLSVSKTTVFVLESSLAVDSFDSEMLESEVYDTHFSARPVPTLSSTLAALSVQSSTHSSYYTISPATTDPSNQLLYSSFEVIFGTSVVSPSLLMVETPALTPEVSDFLPSVETSEHLKATLPRSENVSYPSPVTTPLPDFLASESLDQTSNPKPSLDLVSSLVSGMSTEASSFLPTEYLGLFDSQLNTFAVFETMILEKLLSTSSLGSSFLKPEPTTLNILAASANQTNLAVVLESSVVNVYYNSILEMMPSFESVSSSIEVIQPTLMPYIFESSLSDNSNLISSDFITSTVAIITDAVVTPSSTVDLLYSSSSTSHIFPDVFPSSTETVWIATSLSLTPSPPPIVTFSDPITVTILTEPSTRISIGNSLDPTPMTILTVPTTKLQTGNLTPTPNSGGITTPASSPASKPTSPVTAGTVISATPQNFVCDVNEPDSYLITAVLSSKVTTPQDVVRSIKDALSQHFKRHVELQVHQAHQELKFMVTAGSVVFSGPAVLNSLIRTTLLSGNSPLILSLQPALAVPDHQAQVQIVLQFVPRYVDVRFCNFTQRIEKGLTMAFAEVHRRRQEREGFTVQVINVTHATENFGGSRQGPVNITFAINSSRGFLNGSDVSDLLRILNLVEFSFYLGFPVLKTAEPIYYPELNRSHLLKASWIKTVLLGVHDNHIQDKTFQAELERKLAQLISEATRSGRRQKRASTLGNNTVQVVNITKVTGDGNPTELIYFVEKQNGERLDANEAANLINKVDIQRAAIVLGYRIQGALAQPVEIIATSSPTDENKNLWIIVAVIVPVIVVAVIIMILYWKFCRTDKLEFQPDTMSNIQQRQKLQVPSVKGFDFAKQHIGQHGKDDILVIHEGLPPPPAKDATPSEKGDVSSPQPKAAKLSKGLRQRSRVSPSEAESTASERSSGRESIEDIPRLPATPTGGNRHTVIRNGPAQISRTDEQPSSASIFDHVDRMSRPSEAGKRLPSKIQLIAMQPIPAPPLQNPLLPERVAETNKINKEVQRALRQKSEIEHHRNKIRLRAKRKGHYDFPIMDEVGTIDTKERRKAYRRAQVHIDRILDPSIVGPSVLVEPRKSYRTKRSPRQRRRHQVNGSMMDAEKDRLITTDSDGTYKKPPGVNNAAYVSDPDLPREPRLHSPSHAHPPPPAPPPYIPPQPSIEEARQQMYSLLDDAFALAAPGSPGKVQSAVCLGQPATSTPIRGTRVSANSHWTPVYEQPQSLSNPYVTRYEETGMNPPSGACHLRNHGTGYMQPGEEMRKEQSQQEAIYSNRPIYAEEFQTRSSGHNPGLQAYPGSQSRMESRMGSQPGHLRIGRPGPAGDAGWSPYGLEDGLMQIAPNREPPSTREHLEYVSPLFQMQRTSLRDPSAPSLHLQHSNAQHPGASFDSTYTEDLAPGQSSTSLIKAIREELLRLSQKQSAFQNLHS